MVGTVDASPAVAAGSVSAADTTARGSVAVGSVSAAGTTFPAAAASERTHTVPTMPTIPYDPQHRPKLRRRLPIPACVARPVSRREQRANDDARKAMKKDWDRLRSMDTWDETEVLEWRDVARKARS